MADFDIRERLTQKLGPLPVWSWGVIVGVIVLVGYFLYSRTRSGTISDITTSPQTGSNIDSMGYYTNGINGAAGGSDDIARAENNMTWLNRVSRQVADTLGKSPSEVYAALYKYITGQDYTAAEKTYIDKAIQVGMSPPEGTQGLGSVIPNGIPVPQPGTIPAPTTSREKALAALNSVFGGNYTDAIAKLVDPKSGYEISITNWAAELDKGLTVDQIKSRMYSGGTYQAWIKGQGA